MGDLIDFRGHARVRETPTYGCGGVYSPWRRWYALWPVVTSRGECVWLTHVWRREFTPVSWFWVWMPIPEYRLTRGYR